MKKEDGFSDMIQNINNDTFNKGKTKIASSVKELYYN